MEGSRKINKIKQNHNGIRLVWELCPKPAQCFFLRLYFSVFLFFFVLNFAKIKKVNIILSRYSRSFRGKSRKISNSWNIYNFENFFSPFNFEFNLVVFSEIVILLFYLGS